MARAILLLLCIVRVNSFAQPAGRGVISGSVVEASSGDAVRKAVVTVTWHGTPRAWATTRTDGSGRFTFEGLPAGAYDLRAAKQGLGMAIYGANSVRELGDVITLGDGETRQDLKLRFLHSGSISGRVVDPDGDPVVGANVSMLRAGRNLGERILTNFQGAATNDRGEYKFTGIDPGEYYLRCVANIQGRMGVVSQPILVPQYFGGGRDSKDAVVISLRGGDTLTGIDFHLSAEHPAKITGRVTGVPQLDPPTEAPMPGGGMVFRNGRRFIGGGGQVVAVELLTADDNQLFWGNNGGTGAQGPEYRFEMPDNLPGRYRVQASARAKDKTYYASQLIDAHEGANDIVLTMTPAVELKGTLKVEGPGTHPVESFTVALAPPGSGPRGGSYSSAVKKDGSFAIQDIPPGEWLLNINGNVGGTFEKLVRLGDKDFLFKRIEIPPGLDAPLTIVLSSNTGTITGEIDAGGTGGAGGAKRAGILLEPVGKWHTLARFYYGAVADDNGKFKLNGVAPGKYKIFALEKIATASYRNQESAELLDALGEETEVTEGAKIELHPKLIPYETAKEILKP
jgi:protocatechuate 3,4-dioxygenase beta subunit